MSLIKELQNQISDLNKPFAGMLQESRKLEVKCECKKSKEKEFKKIWGLEPLM